MEPKAPRAGSGYSMSLRATSPALNGHPHCWKAGYWLQTPSWGLKVSGEQTSYVLKKKQITCYKANSGKYKKYDFYPKV